jgi:transcriptional regulator with XRE-family HTH domain
LIKKLSELRRNHSLKQDEVAEILGVGRTTYAMYEQGNREMDYASLIKLADHYKVSLDYILGRSEIPIHPESYNKDEIEFMIRALGLYIEMKQKFNT